MVGKILNITISTSNLKVKELLYNYFELLISHIKL